MKDNHKNLFGRNSFTSELALQLGKCEENNSALGLLFIKLRDMRAINDSFGVPAGDTVLDTFYSQLAGILRPQDCMAHISGGKFALSLPGIMNTAHTILAANKILSLCEEPFQVDGQDIPVQIHIGIVLYPENSKKADWLLHCAEHAALTARENHEAFAVYIKPDIENNSRSLIIKRDLDIAIHAGELEMHYQPQIDLQTRQVCGVEALVRWPRPNNKYISPATFIPIAEQSTSIIPLTLWTINTSLRECVACNTVSNKINLAINMSAAVLNSTDIIHQVSSAINIWGIAKENLCLEVTESAIMADPDKSMRILNEFSDMGILISIDDFGTGYSSMAYLKQLPVNELKIDKSFVINMLHSEDDRSIVRSIIDLAHNFDLHVVAEGIEDEDTLEVLAYMGCDRGQGFYMARPMPSEQIQEWVKSSPWGGRCA